jgi:predicted acyltransferase
LSQIGLGYPFLFALGMAGDRLRWASLVAILVGYWLFFVLYSPPLNWDAGLAHVPRNWSHDFSGFASHWNFNKNPAWAFDRWFMNLFPRKNEFMGNGGAYSTLSFIPTLGTMVLGLIAGQWLQDRNSNAEPLRKLIIAGTICIATGILLDKTGICPSVKKIWTPSWTLFSGGWCFLLMAAFYALIDFKGWKKWAIPLVVIGTNSIAMYVMVYTQTVFFKKAITTHFGRTPFRVFGDAFEQTLHGAAVLMLLWLILLWMYRRKVFLKI